MKVLLADFQFLTRKGLSALIASIAGFEMVCEVDDPLSLSPLVKKAAPDLVVVDLEGKEEVLLEEIESLSATAKIPFLVISNMQHQAGIQRLLNAGVKGILTKNCSEEEITEGLKAVANGDRFFCNTVLEMTRRSSQEADNCDPTTLSAREYEVLTLITKGLKTSHIADELSLSVHTINSHRKSILKKLGMRSPTELVVYAIESGLVAKSAGT